MSGWAHLTKTFHAPPAQLESAHMNSTKKYVRSIKTVDKIDKRKLKSDPPRQNEKKRMTTFGLEK